MSWEMVGQIMVLMTWAWLLASMFVGTLEGNAKRRAERKAGR